MDHRGIINQIILVGTVEGEPDVRYFGYDSLEVRFRLHTQERIPLKQGEGERTLDLWHQISCRGELAKQVEQEVRSGCQLAVVGAIRYHRDTDRFGVSRTVTEIEAQEAHLLQEATGTPPTTRDETLPAPLEPMDWSEFAPSADEDPMA